MPAARAMRDGRLHLLRSQSLDEALDHANRYFEALAAGADSAVGVAWAG